MLKDKLQRLKKELKKYQSKLTQMQKDWAKSKVGSRYGDEYLETQIKVYNSMIQQIQQEILNLKQK
ncbi:hypothetical protein KKE45_02455 [Patescibacteria group bacterium]|nr:hypothetical protein [Patescibacteria group bacterium]